VRLEELGKLKKIHLIGTRIRDLPACSTVPQPTTLPHAPHKSGMLLLIIMWNQNSGPWSDFSGMMFVLVFVKISHLVLKLKEKQVHREHDDFLSMSSYKY
jgi:hypothetical protein